jgi:glycosyltransferase involved in cell wall biosynthesis
MRILYMLNTLGIGGAERLVVAIAERMDARGHTVGIATLQNQRGDEWATPLDVVRLGIDKHPLRVLAGFRRGLRILHEFGPHILHSHNFHGNLLARTLKLVHASTPVISTLHNEYEGGKARMLALRLTNRACEQVVAVSEAVAERASQFGIFPATKSRVITNGIDLADFTPNTSRRKALRAAEGASGNFIWITAGRLAPAKDYENLLLAFAQVRATAPLTQLWIAGEGEREYSDALRIRADQLGLADRVHWLGMRRDLAGLLDAADGFVLGSAWEGMPLAVAEAMAMEKPIAATGVGGVSELVDQCGLVVPPRDPNALARAMLSIIHTPERARAFLGRSARQRIVDHFNIDRKADEWEALYREIAGQSGR